MAIPKRYAHLVGAKFTHATRFLGWRHFHVGSLRRNGKGWDAEVISSVESVTRSWVNAASLFDAREWSPGWTLLKDLVTAASRSPAAENRRR